MREKNFQKQVLRYLKDKGFYVLNVEGLQPGAPDIIGCFHGDFVGIELKVGKNKTTPLQRANLRAIEKNGGKAIVLYYIKPNTWKKILDVL